MRYKLASLANWAHRQKSPWIRRPVLVAAMLGLLGILVVWWIVLTPALWIIVPVLKGGAGLIEAIRDLPGLTARQAVSDWRLTGRDISGFLRIWRGQKVDTVVEWVTPNA